MNEEVEIWKDVSGYEGYYQVSSFGRVLGLERQITQWNESAKKSVTRIQKSIYMSPFEDKDGYLKVQLTKDGIRNKFFVHRLVALNFIPNPESKPEVNHKEGNKKDNRVQMLEWNTTSENQRHAIANKLYETARGETSGQAKLKEVEVREIHKLWKSGEVTQQYLSDMFGVAGSAISRIVNGVRWNHIYNELNGV
jgi:hypothetical protein